MRLNIVLINYFNSEYCWSLILAKLLFAVLATHCSHTIPITYSGWFWTFTLFFARIPNDPWRKWPESEQVGQLSIQGESISKPERIPGPIFILTGYALRIEASHLLMASHTLVMKSKFRTNNFKRRTPNARTLLMTIMVLLGCHQPFGDRFARLFLIRFLCRFRNTVQNG